jgi:hypothetical protein
MKAAEAIYSRLQDSIGKENSVLRWDEIEPRLRTLMGNSEKNLDKRCKKWREEFSDLFDPTQFIYDKYEWRDQALKPKRKKSIKWDNLPQAELGLLRFKMTDGFYDSKWVKFHRAALKQRHYVLENLL